MNGNDLVPQQKQLAYNLTVVKALWKSKWNNFGASGIKGNEYDFNSLYRSIERGKETLRQYIKCNYQYREKPMHNWACRIEAKTGIPHGYLTGEQRIMLGDHFEKVYYPMYMAYCHEEEQNHKQIEAAGNACPGPGEPKKDPPDFTTTEEIRQFVEANCTPEEQQEFHESTDGVNTMAKHLTLFQLGLAKESGRIMGIDTARLMQQDDRLCRLVYFIRFRKKYDGLSILNLEDMRTAMKRTRTRQLRDLGKEGLREYIQMLEEHLNLARSVYTVAIDCGDFAPDKGKRK